MTKMIRPEWKVLLQDCGAGYVYCECGEILQTTAQVRDHWQLGHFDYVEDESLVAEMLEALMSIRNIVQVAFVAGGWTALETEEMEEIVQIANTAIAKGEGGE